MMENQKDKMMRSQPRVTLVCLSECVINGFGVITKDQEIDNPLLIDYLTKHGEHPNFKVKEA